MKLNPLYTQFLLHITKNNDKEQKKRQCEEENDTANISRKKKEYLARKKRKRNLTDFSSALENSEEVGTELG
jgi:hypothetical protein